MYMASAYILSNNDMMEENQLQKDC